MAMVSASLAATIIVASLLWSGVAQAAAAPAVVGLSPSSGTTTGGLSVTVYGTGFVAGSTAVSFGATPATTTTVVSSTELTAVDPAGSAGSVHVTATVAGVTSATSSSDVFTYAQLAPANLQVDGMTPTEVALRWTAPAVSGIIGYVVFRDGQPIETVNGTSVVSSGSPPPATTDGYTTSYVDNGVAAGSSHTYSVEVDTTGGLQGQSGSLDVTTPTTASETPLSGQCPTAPLVGNTRYVLTGDLTASSGYCLTSPIGGGATTNVTLDCQGHKINTSGNYAGLDVSDWSHFFIVNCVFDSAGADAYISSSSDGTLDNDQFNNTSTALQAGVGGSSNASVAVIGSQFVNANVALDLDTGGLVEANTITNPGEYYQEAPILLVGTSGDVVDGNAVDGGAPQSIANQETTGADDGIALYGLDNGVEYGTANDAVVKNTVSNVWDAGIEPSGILSGTTISGNTISDAYIDAIGTYHEVSWANDVVSANTASASGQLFMFLLNDDLLPTQTTTYFEYNTFSGNSFTAPNDVFQQSAIFESASSSVPLTTVGNVISSNSFGTLPAPIIEPATIFATATNNSCPETPTGAGTINLACPAITSVTPSSGPVSGGTQITVLGSGFTADGPVTGVTVAGLAATNVDVISDTKLTATVPAFGSSVPAPVVVSTGGIAGALVPATAVASAGFTYLPIITQLTPTKGAPGTELVIKGSGFSGVRSVWFGSVKCPIDEVVGNTEIVALVPSGLANGTYDITLKTLYGTSQTVSADRFTVN